MPENLLRSEYSLRALERTKRTAPFSMIHAGNFHLAYKRPPYHDSKTLTLIRRTALRSMGLYTGRLFLSQQPIYLRGAAVEPGES